MIVSDKSSQLNVGGGEGGNGGEGISGGGGGDGGAGMRGICVAIGCNMGATIG